MHAYTPHTLRFVFDFNTLQWDALNNVETAAIDSHLYKGGDLAAVHVYGSNIPAIPQTYALVVTGRFEKVSTAECDAAAAHVINAHVGNNGDTTAAGDFADGGIGDGGVGDSKNGVGGVDGVRVVGGVGVPLSASVRCPNGCGGATQGSCDAATGRCVCAKHRAAADCSIISTPLIPGVATIGGLLDCSYIRVFVCFSLTSFAELSIVTTPLTFRVATTGLICVL
jgi:hypothetical protein